MKSEQLLWILMRKVNKAGERALAMPNNENNNRGSLVLFS